MRADRQFGVNVANDAAGSDLGFTTRDPDRSKPSVRVDAEHSREVLSFFVWNGSPLRRRRQEHTRRSVVHAAVAFVLRGTFAHDVGVFEELTPAVVRRQPKFELPARDEPLALGLDHPRTASDLFAGTLFGRALLGRALFGSAPLGGRALRGGTFSRHRLE